MEKIGIFGKKNSLVKYNLSSHKSLWTANLPHGQTPKAIAQYEDFLIVIDQNWAGTKNISCFNEKTGVLLWRYRYDFLCTWGIYFQPIFVKEHLIFKSGAAEFTKLCCKTGKIVYKKIIKHRRLFSFEKFDITYVGESLIAFSNKEIRKIDIESGNVEIDTELTEKFNVKGVTAHLGRGVSFISSISSFNQQLEDQAKSDAGAGAGAG